MAREVRDRHTARALSCLACACLLLCSTGFADDTVRLRVRDANGFPGGQVTVDITMDAGTNPSAIGFWLEYDSAKLSFVDAVPGAVVTLAGKDVSWDFPALGRVSFLIFGFNATRISSGKILSVTFNIDDSAQPDDEYEIHGLNASATEPDASPIETEFDDGEIDVLDCFEPAAPINFVATNGIFGDHVQLSWLPAFGAQSYVVYRNSVNNPATATVLAVTVLPLYSDFSAQAPSFVSTGGGGCGGTNQTAQYREYYYWVQAKNFCGESSLTPAETGWRGQNNKSLTSLTSLESLPSVASEATSQFSLRLTGDGPIRATTVEAEAQDTQHEIAAVEWLPTDESGTDGWVIVTLSAPLAAGESLTLSASGKTVDNAVVGPVSHSYMCDATVEIGPASIAPKSGETIAVSELRAAAIPGFTESIGPRYCIEPAVPFDGPKHVTVPVPGGVEPGEVLPYLYVAGEGWYPAPLVEGWILPGSIAVVEEDGWPCIAFDAYAGGIVQLGYAAIQTTPAGASTWSGAIPIIAAALALAASSIRRRFIP